MNKSHMKKKEGIRDEWNQCECILQCDNFFLASCSECKLSFPFPQWFAPVKGRGGKGREKKGYVALERESYQSIFLPFSTYLLLHSCLTSIIFKQEGKKKQ